MLYKFIESKIFRKIMTKIGINAANNFSKHKLKHTTCLLKIFLYLHL